MNKLQAMEVFVQVVDTGSFTRAADQMQLPKATVSTLVQGLENALAVKLLHRTTRHVSVTADGAVYYERVLRILSEVRDAEESLSRERASPSGRLRIDVATGVANEIIIPALPDFFTRYPDIALEMGCGDRPVDLVEEGVDCAIRGGALPDSNLIARRIGVLHFVTGASASYIDRHGQPAHPNDLLNHVCVNYFGAKSNKVHDWDFVRGDEEVRIALPGSLAVNDSTAYLNAGLAGLGVIQMPAFSMQPHFDSGALLPMLQDWTSAPLPVHVVYPQNRHLSAKVRVFVEWVADLFLSHPGFQITAPARKAA